MRTSLKVTFAALSLIAAGTLVACSSGSKDSSDKATSVVIATDGATKPFTYSDSQGNLTGYDIEVARAVFKKLPQYKVKFQVTDFSGISPGIDSGRYKWVLMILVGKKVELKNIISHHHFQNQTMQFL